MNNHGLCSIATFFKKRCHNTWLFNGDGARPYQIDHILAKRKDIKIFSDCDPIAGVESDHTTAAVTMRIGKFIPRKRRQNQHQAKPQGSQQPTETKTKKKKKTPVGWEAIKTAVDKFNEELDGHINEELQNIDEKWEPGMDCPYKRLSNAMEEAARAVAPSNGARKIQPWFQMSERVIMYSIKSRDQAHLEHKERPTEEIHQTLCQSRCTLTTAKAAAKVKWLASKID
jgi:hypothetical protein